MPVSVMFAAEIRTELQLNVEAANVQKLKARKLFKDYKKVWLIGNNIKSEGWRLHVIILTDEQTPDVFCKIEKAKTFFKAKL